MYRLVADVERYPEFLPMCESLAIESRSEQPGGAELIATMGVGYKAIRESFTTRVLLWPEEPAIHVTYLDGPFRRLDNRWRFHDAPGGSDVEFFIDYEFRSPFFAILMGAVFERAFRRFAESFEERAAAIYGARPCKA
jgi:coenzyme Q-binding protein COQ10